MISEWMRLGDYRLPAGASGSDSKHSDFEKLPKLKTLWQQQSDDKTYKNEKKGKLKITSSNKKLQNILKPELRTQGTEVLGRAKSQQWESTIIISEGKS